MSDGHWHYASDIHGGAEEHHRHYDDESQIAGLREDLGRAEERISELENRIRALEAPAPTAGTSAVGIQLDELAEVARSAPGQFVRGFLFGPAPRGGKP